MKKNLENFPMRLKKNEHGAYFGIISTRDVSENWINRPIPITAPKKVRDNIILNDIVMVDGKFNPTIYKKDDVRKYSFEIIVDKIKEFDKSKLGNNVKLEGFVKKQVNKNGKEFFTLSIKSEPLNEHKREKANTTKDYLYNSIIVNGKKEVIKELEKYEGKFIESSGFLNLNDYNDNITMNYYAREIHEPIKEISKEDKEDYMYKDLEEVESKESFEKEEKQIESTEEISKEEKEDSKEPELEM